MVPFAPNGLSDHLCRVVRDDFIAHVAAGGSAASAAAQLRDIYPASLIGRRAHALLALTLAQTAWEIGRLSPFLKSEALRLLDGLGPAPGALPDRWDAQREDIANRLEAGQPEAVALSALTPTAPCRAGTVWQVHAQPDSATILLLPLTQHWLHGRFHALALGVHPSGTGLLQGDPTQPPCVFVVPGAPGAVTPRTDVRLPRRLVSQARRHLQTIHALLIEPCDLRPVYAGLLR